MIGHQLQRQDDFVQLYFTGHAFIAGAERLCEHALEEREDGHHVPEDVRVILHMAYLGVELYLKAGLIVSGVPYPKHHDLRALRQKYVAEGLDLPLELPHFLSSLLGDVDPELPELTPVPMGRHFERYRYTCDHNGRPFPPLPAVDWTTVHDDLVRLKGSAMTWLYPVLRGWRKPNGEHGASSASPSG